jgi:hypothetical protein
MFFALPRRARRRQRPARPAARVHAAIGVLLVLGVATAPMSAQADGAGALTSGLSFQRGDVFLTGNGSVQEYSPSGQLQRTVSATPGRLCFDPNGTRLIVPGVGLFDSSGNLLTSSWASVTSAGPCVADGLGNVYVVDSGWNLTKYRLDGRAVRTYTVASLPGFGITGIDLAPDECTLYYGAWNGQFGAIGRFNVCTNLQASPFTDNNVPTDDLRVLPNFQVVSTDDPRAELFDASGQLIRSFIPQNPPLGNALRFVSLDPDGTSFWVSSISGSPRSVSRFDLATGNQLAEWPGGGPIAVYGPPLLGDANVGRAVDSDTAGTAEVFLTKARYAGQMTRAHLYVDASNTAGKIVVGIYSDKNGAPEALQREATISNVRAGSWNYVDFSSLPVTAGKRYWIAVLGPKGTGTIRFRDQGSGGGTSQTSALHTLTALPTTWIPGTNWTSAPLSAYGS